MMDYLDNSQSISPDAKPPRQPFPSLVGFTILWPLPQKNRWLILTKLRKTITPVLGAETKTAPAMTNDGQKNTADASGNPQMQLQDQKTDNPKPVNAANLTVTNQDQAKPPAANQQRPKSRYGINEKLCSRADGIAYPWRRWRLHPTGCLSKLRNVLPAGQMLQPPLGSLFIYRAWAHDKGEKNRARAQNICWWRYVPMDYR